MKNAVAGTLFALLGVISFQAAQIAPVYAQVAIKKGCPNKLTAKCPAGKHRVCTQTDSKGCCKKSICEAN